MINHMTLWVNDIEQSKKFYQAALEPLGYVLLNDSREKWVGFGMKDQKTSRDFWLKEGTVSGKAISCIAFTAHNKAAVDNFYSRALEAGGKDNGAPGLRPRYHANYYAAFVIGPDGHNIEVVCHEPES